MVVPAINQALVVFAQSHPWWMPLTNWDMGKCAQIRTAQVIEYLKASMNDDDSWVATIFLKFYRSTLSSKHLKSFVHWKLLVGLSKYWNKKKSQVPMKPNSKFQIEIKVFASSRLDSWHNWSLCLSIPCRLPTFADL